MGFLGNYLSQSLALILCGAIGIYLGISLLQNSDTAQSNFSVSFDECKAEGNLVFDGNPSRCILSNGTIIEGPHSKTQVHLDTQATSSHPKPAYVNVTESDIRVVLPFPNATTGADFVVRGFAHPPWFVEKTFPILLYDLQGNLLAESIAEGSSVQDDQGRYSFSGPVMLKKKYEGQAILVLLKGIDTELGENHPHIFFPITIDP